MLDYPDNITVSPRGGIVICEDSAAPHIRGLTPRGEIFPFAKNIFNTEQVVGVFNRITVDADGFPLDAAGNRMDPSTISTDQSDYVANSWREQRKFQLGLKFYF